MRDPAATHAKNPCAFFERVGEVAWEMLAEYRRGEPVQPWRVIPAARLEAVWQARARDGFVRDSKGLDAIARRFVDNVARLLINTEVAGHTERSTRQALAGYALDEEIPPGDEEAFVDWAIHTPTGGWRISDHALDPLVSIACALCAEPDDEDKLLLVELALQVTHPRSDLAAWFVEGGSLAISRMRGWRSEADAAFGEAAPAPR